MNILFLHRNFPGQFRHLVTELAKYPQNFIFFITHEEAGQISGVRKMVYQINREVPQSSHSYLFEHEDALIHAQAAATIAHEIQKRNIRLDAIYAEAFGPGLFIKYMFPDVPVIIQSEWYNRAAGVDIGFDGIVPEINYKAKLRCSNSCMLMDLYACDAFIVPAEWQKKQFPEEFHEKINVIPNGVDINVYKPDSNAKFTVKDKNLELTAKDEVITYIQRGMEPYRGFPQFMEAVEKILKNRPDTHVVIAGEDKVFCRKELYGENYKQLMLNKLDLDMNRVHFTGNLVPEEYIKLLQVSSVHVYLTFPYILSETLLNAMSAGCCIVASDTQPVLEVLKNNYNGLLVDFFDVDGISEKVEFVLNNRDKMTEIRENARKTIIEKYSVEKTIPQQFNLISNLLVSSEDGI